MKKKHTWMIAGLTAGIVAWGGAAGAQQKQPVDCSKTPATISGKVTKVDEAQKKITMQEASGVTHEFQASPESLKAYKVGDQIQAKLRTTPESCKQG